jgi:hypothetical protein
MKTAASQCPDVYVVFEPSQRKRFKSRTGFPIDPGYLSGSSVEGV